MDRPHENKFRRGVGEVSQHAEDVHGDGGAASQLSERHIDQLNGEDAIEESWSLVADDAPGPELCPQATSDHPRRELLFSPYNRQSVAANPGLQDDLATNGSFTTIANRKIDVSSPFPPSNSAWTGYARDRTG